MVAYSSINHMGYCLLGLAALTGADVDDALVEAAGDDVAATLATLPGVTGHSTEEVQGRARVHLEVAGDQELRPDIFGMARDRGWTLWELHRERASLEQLFRTLTAEAATGVDSSRTLPKTSYW